MKFRASFSVPRESREDGAGRPAMPAIPMPFKVPGFKPKQSKTAYTTEEKEGSDGDDGDLLAARLSRKQAMQDFFKSTGANLMATGANLKAASTAKMPRRMGTRRVRVVRHPSSDENSQVSFDIKDEVVDRLMGPPKDLTRSKIQSNDFFANQRLRASSRQASAAISPLSGKSQAEEDRKPLSVEEIHGMFVGAPYFNVEKLPKDGGYRPQVIFRGGDVEESARYGRDYMPLGHAAFAACTLGLHRTRETAERPLSQSSLIESKLAARNQDLLEVPSMLSANGQDVGTIGFEHFLQLPTADSSIVPDEPTLYEKRRLLTTDPEQLGLREMNMEIVIDRLTELGELHSSARQSWSAEKISELGEDLFSRVLDPELGTTGAGTGSVTLKTQIMALQKVLNEVELWWDFSQVEWRIRVGQLLWASQGEDAPQLDEQRQPSDREVLLLQITLAAELLIRLDMLTALGEPASFPPVVSGDDREAINFQRTRKVEWDLLLAERFLENLSISAKVTGMSKPGNRSSLFSAISFLTAKETPEEAEQSVQPLLFPKQETQQLAGLLHFAEAIQWPHAQDVRTELEAKPPLSTPEQGEGQPESGDRSEHLDVEDWPLRRPISGISTYATPLSSPMLPGYTPAAERTSYFGGSHTQSSPSKRPGLSRMTTAQSMQLLPASRAGMGGGSEDGADKFQGLGGWLSRSWLAGLTLPGEPACHFLISTLLENSPQAIEVLGDSANLYGGFVYDERSFWSSSCVVGRVLGALKGATECMGWISVPSVANQANLEPGWVDLEVKDLPALSSAEVPRIKDEDAVAKASDPLHGAAISSMQAGDFMLPIDGPPVMGNEVRFNGLSFKASSTSFELTKTCSGEVNEGGMRAVSTSVAHLTFSSPINSKLAKLEVPLTYDVHFVASYPCHPQAPAGRSKASTPVVPDGVEVTLPPVVAIEANDEELPPSNKDVRKTKADETEPTPLEPTTTETTSSHDSALFSDAEETIPPPPTYAPPAPPPQHAPPLPPSQPSQHSIPRKPLPPKTDSGRASATDSPSLALSILPGDILAREKELPTPPAHPLHIDFRFDTIPVATLLSLPPETRPRALSLPGEKLANGGGAAGGAQGKGEEEEEDVEIVVLDCRGSAELELLARAWCAKVGENAVVGKTGRTCLACCVREARGLGVGVVIRT